MRAKAAVSVVASILRARVSGTNDGTFEELTLAGGTPRRDGATRLIESRMVLELQSARGIRSAYGSTGTCDVGQYSSVS